MRLTTGYFAAPSSLDSLAIMRLSLWLKRTIPMSAADPLNPKVPDGLVDLQDTALQAQGLPGPQVHPKALSILRNSVKWCSVLSQTSGRRRNHDNALIQRARPELLVSLTRFDHSWFGSLPDFCGSFPRSGSGLLALFRW